MDLFGNYITKHANFQSFITDVADKELFNVVVIPALGEPHLLETILSLSNCTKPQRAVEILIVINASECSGPDIIEINDKNNSEILNWANSFNTDKFKIHLINISNIPKKDAGAGYARKTGMDEAIRRFISADVRNGIITSLDADSLVSCNYLIELENLFLRNKECNACSVYFEHPTEGKDFQSEVYETMIDYELHLRYYKQTLKYIGFPYYHHTVGSCFAVRASTYCKQGGMNKKQAGEDFYFLHKIIPLGNFYELNSACVYPSPRPSDRVPFGTGAAIRQYAVENKLPYLTYNFDTFIPLKQLFTDKNLFYKENPDKIDFLFSELELHLKEFLELNDFKDAIKEINNNSNTLHTFSKRFFNWFDAFRLIKYLNFVHEKYAKKQLVKDAVMSWFDAAGIQSTENLDTLSLLYQLRLFEKEY